MTTGHAIEAVVHARRTGANGIPDLPVEADAVKQPSEDPTVSDRETARNRVASTQKIFVGLIAVSALAVGTIGACRGWMRSRRHRPLSSSLGAVPDPHALTPPHGDKLLRRQ
jgi:hypothetical protein